MFDVEYIRRPSRLFKLQVLRQVPYTLIYSPVIVTGLCRCTVVINVNAYSNVYLYLSNAELEQT